MGINTRISWWPRKFGWRVETCRRQVVLVCLEWFRRNSVLKCVLQPKIAKNSRKPPIFEVQGRSRSLMLVPPESSSAVLVMISSKYVSICNRFHVIDEPIVVKLRFLKGAGGIRIWCPRSRGISSSRGTKLPYKKLESLGYHMMKTRSLYLTWPWIRTRSWLTDGRTEFP